MTRKREKAPGEIGEICRHQFGGSVLSDDGGSADSAGDRHVHSGWFGAPFVRVSLKQSTAVCTPVFERV